MFMPISDKPRRKCRSLFFIGALLALASWGQGAHAQDMSTYYTVKHPTEFPIDWATFYHRAEAMTAAARDALPHHLDLPYGELPKQRLDLYLPKRKPTHAPVLLFLHGGGFREGDRAQYGFVAKPYAERGIIVAIASYRLTGDGFKYPDQPHDAQRALAWLYQHVAEHGGDPMRLFIAGHSAGAVLAAEIGADLSWMSEAGIPQSAFLGIAPVSGRYDLRTGSRPGEGDAYVPTPELADEASPLLHIKKPVPAAVIALGSTEMAIQESSRAFTEKLRAAGATSKMITLEGADHKDTVLSLADEHSVLFQAVSTMILHTGRGKSH
jgi:acetyl esterase/lipase